ncbi:hypothetical protein Tco_0458564 [Tanacetum coccineum]
MLDRTDFESWQQRIRLCNSTKGIPKDIYSLINHYTDAKDIWENVKMILEGSELTKDDRESQLYDEFEHFVHSRRNHSRSTTLVERFITEVKLNRGLKESNCDQLYAYLKQHEVHANENRIMMERFCQPNNDPLALVSNASVQQSSFQQKNLIERFIQHSLALLTNPTTAHLPSKKQHFRASSNKEQSYGSGRERLWFKMSLGRYNVNKQAREWSQGQIDYKIQTTSRTNATNATQEWCILDEEQSLFTLQENSLKAQLRSKEPCFTSDYVKPKVLDPGMYAIDVKPILHPLKNNRSAHLNYISHLKESVETSLGRLLRSKY